MEIQVKKKRGEIKVKDINGGKQPGPVCNLKLPTCSKVEAICKKEHLSYNKK